MRLGWAIVAYSLGLACQLVMFLAMSAMTVVITLIAV